jgi:hypothetical protein
VSRRGFSPRPTARTLLIEFSMRVALVLLIVLHAGLLLLGFLKPWKLAALPQLSGRTLVPLSDVTGRAVGLLWLVAALVLLGAAVLLVARSELWWLAGIAGLALSQALIVFQWSDAKAGTVANVLIAVAVVVGAATHRFKGEVSDQVRGLLASAARADGAIVRASDIQPLPPPVRAWLVRSGVVGKARARTLRLKQRGEMRTSPEQAWMPARAEQYFSVDPPGFVWSVDVTMFRVVPIVGRDSYSGGKGRMLIKAASLVNVVDASGDKIDQGTLLRFLGEIVWFPSAALSPHITWQAVDRTTARATMSYRGVSASALFSFDEHGRFSTLRAQRYMGSGDAAKLEEWVVPATRWRVVRGIEIPVSGEVVWKLKAGDFSYYRWEIEDVEVDATAPYQAVANASAVLVRASHPASSH